ncbi:hypothetical protein BRD02_03390 [Halobacteriales archaeon QS_8_69_73]|nr:MAG: hypothetical protein BRD02_03390 [Halobacteriales archaeon QS_8_69_73]
MSAGDGDAEAVPRRRLLSAFVLVGTTGCTFDTSSSGAPRTLDSTPTGENPTAEPADGPSPTSADGTPETYRPAGSERTELRGSPFTELRADTLPDAAPFGAGVEFLAQPAGEEPGRLAVELRNRTDDSLGVEGGVPDGSGESETGIAVSDGWADRASDDCPRGYRQADAATTALWFDPNETVRETYDIHATHNESVCFPEGAHRIESDYRVYPGEKTFTDDPAFRFCWGFRLVVERS